jgi:site-specific DNA recombinase
MRRDKGGKEACPAKPMPAPVIEEYVVGRLVEATADGALVEGARSALESHLAERRERLMTRRAKLPGQIAKASANVARYVEELTRLQGRAREAVAQRLEQESERLATLEETMAEAERTLDALDAQRVEGEWVAQALGDFSRVWSALTPANQGRLLRALVERVAVDERSGRVEVHLVNFAADTEGDVATSEEEPEEAAA